MFNKLDYIQELEEYIGNKTKEEFIKSVQSEINEQIIQCPNNFGLLDYCYDGTNSNCKLCWENAYDEVVNTDKSR